MVSVGAERNARAFAPSDLEERDVEILTIGITVDFERLIQLRRFDKNARPIGGQTESEVVNTPARVAENVKLGIPQRS